MTKKFKKLYEYLEKGLLDFDENGVFEIEEKIKERNEMFEYLYNFAVNQKYLYPFNYVNYMINGLRRFYRFGWDEEELGVKCFIKGIYDNHDFPIHELSDFMLFHSNNYTWFADQGDGYTDAKLFARSLEDFLELEAHNFDENKIEKPSAPIATIHV